MLFRKIESLIEEHLKSGSPKILLVDGARQVSPSFLHAKTCSLTSFTVVATFKFIFLSFLLCPLH